MYYTIGPTARFRVRIPLQSVLGANATPDTVPTVSKPRWVKFEDPTGWCAGATSFVFLVAAWGLYTVAAGCQGQRASVV